MRSIIQSAPVTEQFGGAVVWEGVVHVFALAGHLIYTENLVRVDEVIDSPKVARNDRAATASPWQNGFAERLMDQSGASVWTISSSWTRRICVESCEPMLAITTTSERTGIISSHAILGGLHHHYVRV